MNYQVDSVPASSHHGYSDNQICQWYCCACGQSYGSIIYRDHRPSDPSMSATPTTPTMPAAPVAPATPAKSPHCLNEYLLQSLKHYSLLIYNHAPPTANVDSNYTTDTPVRSPGSFEEVPSLAGPRDGISLKVPTRFTCHRCDHMMCPYCPKVRVKDLAYS
ncbi:uncharacterized protein CANTADRAFT_109967 [Suhomyces tanzawaensis NRRL Y-17324]|uniref:Uncharacterized protein n=1 Tax=Suhomyces tanzawaensis NRRL Y-17324 TaxID=984487 RepID=A0A1E4SPQ2_9ASCO|nr:uncharacterized protein CANTADRAFT_109967 [Suhomyces tanzawaensis NRRL Y-17324]ODV81475.1 hypothetical protein CANTADRAFT_109967 [Suhomyces tanzawaensis NRRL Y-17324]